MTDVELSFEIRDRDLLARIGKIRTKSGTIETPVVLPVVSPVTQSISPQTLYEEFNCKALMTNAYILKQHKGVEAGQQGIHDLLDYRGVVMTDSGAYQILVYGNIDISPEEIVRYQEEISTDIATILDIPTDWRTTMKHARQTVEETIHRAKQLTSIKTRDDILWVGPIQGGQYLDLVAYCARKVGEMPFQIHALGSPTPILEQYRFDILVDMILTAKMNMPLHKPLHLFGAGHPMVFALTVALGCDLFDSAAYAIFARADRYMTEYGTIRLGNLEYFPCTCPVCAKHTPEDVREMQVERRQELLARHNLYASFAELARVKQFTVEGRLWEYLEGRAHTHPALMQALRRLKRYKAFLEEHTPLTKRRGMFFFSGLGLIRPEIVRYQKRLRERYSPPPEAEILILLPRPSKRPFHKASEVKQMTRTLAMEFPESPKKFHICIYAPPFGVVPLELDEIYPLSQHEIAFPLDNETMSHVTERISEFISEHSYKKTVLIEDDKPWSHEIAKACKERRRKDLSITIIRVEKPSGKRILDDVVKTLRRMVV